MILKKIDYNSKDYLPCDLTPKRIIRKYELEIYTRGEGVSYVNDKIYAHSGNKIIFAKPGQERFSTGHFHCYSLHFICDDRDLLEALDHIPDCFIVSPQTRAKLIKYYEKIEPENSISTYAALFNIIELLSRENTVPTDYVLVPSQEVSWVKDYIDNHFTTSIDLADLSKQVYLSPNYLRKKFAEAYGTTVQKYIIDMRLGMVKKLLLTTNKSLSEIAYCSGFNSQSHMNVMFRSYFGVTPLEYKKQLQQA